MKQSLAGTILVIGGCLSLPAAAEDAPFHHDYIELGYSRMVAESGTAYEETDISGYGGRINLSLNEHAWLAIEHDKLSSDDFADGIERGLEYSTLTIGAGQQVTDRGMWYVETGQSFSRLSGQDTQRSVVFAIGIRTLISPRFELGGGPRFDGANRLEPEKGEWGMRVHGLLRMSERVQVSGLYDYRDNAAQWRVGLRLEW